MHDSGIIIKEEIDIDDTKIKLEMNDYEDSPSFELSCARQFMKIIEEKPNMITVPVHDCKSEDELKFIASLGMLDDQQQKLFEAPSCKIDIDMAAISSNKCEICSFMCANHLMLASHQINHQLNRHFCCYGCGVWCNSLEDINEHEYRKHAAGVNNFSCRICKLACPNTVTLTQHMCSHIYMRRFVCAICRRHFGARQGLQLHRQHSKEVCGRLEYVDIHGNVGQLVAVIKVDANLPADVDIKTEPFDIDDEIIMSRQISSEFIIKSEPEDKSEIANAISEDSRFSFNKTTLTGQIRGKLRLPAISRPFEEEHAKAKESLQMPVKIKFVPAGKWNPKSPSIASTKRPNILKHKKVDNHQPVTNNLKNDTLILPRDNSNCAVNVLRPLPSNCMLINLPPNTKIIKIPPTVPSVNTNEPLGSKIITLPNTITITTSNPSFNSQNLISPASSVGSAVKSSAQVMSCVPGPSDPVNRNAYFNALSVFESLPESRKIIKEFQNQIRNIEQTLPLPGSVLQTQNKNTNSIMRTQFEVLKLSPTKINNVKVRELRQSYPDYRLHWECPKCARCYELYVAFRNHLTSAHGIDPSDIEKLEVGVKAYRKLNISSGEEKNEEESVPTQEAVADISGESDSGAMKPICKLDTSTNVSGTSTHVVTADALSSGVKTPAAPIPAAVKPTKTARSQSMPRPAQYQCDECSKCFTTVGAVRIHKMIHTGELPHKCNFCEKRFRTPGQVRVHQRRHTGEKPFKCKVCSLDFTHRETLISHLSRHIGMKRYKCYGCDKNFVVVSGLRAHRRLRPDTCGKVKFTARAHGPRVRVIRGEVVFESHPEHNGYLRSEDPLNILSEINQVANVPSADFKDVS